MSERRCRRASFCGRDVERMRRDEMRRLEICRILQHSASANRLNKEERRTASPASPRSSANFIPRATSTRRPESPRSRLAKRRRDNFPSFPFGSDSVSDSSAESVEYAESDPCKCEESARRNGQGKGEGKNEPRLGRFGRALVLGSVDRVACESSDTKGSAPVISTSLVTTSAS